MLDANTGEYTGGILKQDMTCESCKGKKWINLTKSKFITCVKRNHSKSPELGKHIYSVYRIKSNDIQNT